MERRKPVERDCEKNRSCREEREVQKRGGEMKEVNSLIRTKSL